MDNRFGVKDFVLVLLLLIIIVMIALAMFQYDRQWTVLQQTNQQLTELTGDVARVRQRVEQGAFATTQAASTQDMYTGLERVVKSYSSPDYAEGDTLTMVSQAPPDKLTPVVSTDLLSFTIQGEVMDALLGRDPDTFAFTPNLASDWHVSDDLLTIDFTLKRGITFSDGSPFMADDVVFTFELSKNPKLEAPGEQSLLDHLTSVEKIDDYHVRFHFDAPYFLSLITAGNTPILSKAFYSKYSIDDLNQSTGLLIGSGPYRMADPTSWTPQPGQPIVLLRNERYWGPRPSFNKIIWKIIENPSARTTAFTNGDIDCYGTLSFGPSPESFDQMLKNPAIVARTQHYALDSPVQGYFYIGWNVKVGRDGPPSPFADPRVRRAMTMLCDRQRIIRDILHGYGTICTGPFPPSSPQADPTIQPWPYDPDGALKLLAEAGYVYKGDRVYGPDGQPLKIKLMYPNEGYVLKRCIPLIQDAFARAGVEVDPDPQEWTVFLQRTQNRQFEAAVAGWGGVIDNDLYQIFDSHFSEGAGDDFTQYVNKDLDAAIEQARITADETKRNELWHKCAQIIHQDQPYTFLFIDREMTIMDSRIHGVEPTKVGLNSPQEWYVPKALQKYHD
ncbi:MAG: ABC transporter substrate-binding protein [Tepidisphaeraceae bacterium]|jgi:peptide/nickel transport system substrate-binding protein